MGFQKGHKAWNKGLTKETDERIKSVWNKGLTKETDERVKRIGEKLKGRKYTDETLKKMSKSMKGRIPWNKGKTGIYTDETLKKIGDAQKGKKLSDKTKKKMSKAQKGKKKKPFTEEHKKNISKSAKERYKKYKHPMLGRKHTQEAKDKISVVNKGNVSPMKGKHPSKETRKKMSESGKKKIFSEEHKKNLIKAKKKNPTWNKGLTKETDERVRKMSEVISGEKHPMWNPNREEVYLPYGENFFNSNIRNRKWNLQKGRDMLTGIKLDPNKKPAYHHIDYDKFNDDPNNLCFVSHGNHSRITSKQSDPIKSERYKRILQENTLALKNDQIPKNWSPLNKELFRQEKLKQLDLSSYII